MSRLDLQTGIVVIDPDDLCVVCGRHPALPGDEICGACWDKRELDRGPRFYADRDKWRRADFEVDRRKHERADR